MVYFVPTSKVQHHRLGTHGRYSLRGMDLEVSKYLVSGSATEQWHWRVLFGDGQGGGEPNRFCWLSNIRRSGRRSFAVTTQNHDFFGSIRDLGVLDVVLYTRNGERWGLKKVRSQVRDLDSVDSSIP